MRKALHDKHSLTAILAAMLFVVQMMVSSWAVAGSLGQPMADMFGNPICATDMNGGPVSPAKEHGKLPACCAVGCSAFSANLLAFPVEPTPAALAPMPEAALVFPRAVCSTVRLDHDPGNPRAPPLTA